MWIVEGNSSGWAFDNIVNGVSILSQSTRSYGQEQKNYHENTPVRSSGPTGPRKGGISALLRQAKGRKHEIRITTIWGMIVIWI